MKTVIHRAQPTNPIDHQDFQAYRRHNRQHHQEDSRKVREDQSAGQDRYGRAHQCLIPERSG